MPSPNYSEPGKVWPKGKRVPRKPLTPPKDGPAPRLSPKPLPGQIDMFTGEILGGSNAENQPAPTGPAAPDQLPPAPATPTGTEAGGSPAADPNLT